MTTIIRYLDNLTEWLGRCTAVFSLFIALATFSVVVMRYGFNISAIALQESVIYLHSALFMLAAGYALKHNAHVRVDIFYRTFGPQGRAWVNLLGCVFLLFPMAGFIFYASLDFVHFSWSIQERSSEADGLPYLYLLKSLIPAMAVLLVLQAVSECLRSLQTLLGLQDL